MNMNPFVNALWHHILQTFDDLCSILRQLLPADLRVDLLSHGSKGDCSVDVLSVDYLGDV